MNSAPKIYNNNSLNFKSGFGNDSQNKFENESIAALNLKSYYESTEEKLNDILIERTRNKQSTSMIEYNISQYEKLPQVIKDCIHPQDVYSNGHIEQSKVNELWDAAIKAKRDDVFGQAPPFMGKKLSIII